MKVKETEIKIHSEIVLCVLIYTERCGVFADPNVATIYRTFLMLDFPILLAGYCVNVRTVLYWNT